MALRAVGTALRAVGVVSRAESLVQMWLLYRMASAILVWHLECGYSIFQLNLISHYQFSQEVIWEEKKGVFSQVGSQNAFLFLHYE